MKEYREKLKIDTVVTAVCCCILAVFCILAAVSEFVTPILPTPRGDSHWQSMWRGFISGATFAVLAMMIYSLVRSIHALRCEEALKKLYIKQHDERMIKIWIYARSAAYQVFLILGIVAVVVAGYFNMVVSLTILGCIFFNSIIGLLFKLYYSKKF
ncbi:MAG: hypothetical protein J6J18_05885 [Oscillospiraceae bacterium]|nr:hypothetical protein [Oscillospiraceae bacterium]